MERRWCGTTSNLTLPPNLFLLQSLLCAHQPSGSGTQSCVIPIPLFLHPLYPVIRSWLALPPKHIPNLSPYCHLYHSSLAKCHRHWLALLPEPPEGLPLQPIPPTAVGAIFKNTNHILSPSPRPALPHPALGKRVWE